jgi:multicomponent Na+:H+ antiporter subunit E
VRRWPVAGALLALLWLFVSGVDPGSEPVRNVAGAFLTGLVIGLPVAFLTRRVYGERFVFARSARAPAAATLYLLRFLYELLTANVDVAYRVLAPSMPIEPDVVAVPLRVESAAAITTIANSITLTPGTLTMDYEEATNTLYVHAITGQDNYDGVVAPIRAWEDYALVIFDEDLDPDDPAPGRPSPVGPGGATPADAEPAADGATGVDEADRDAEGGERRG